MLNGASLAVEASGSSGQHFPALAGCFMWGDKTRRHARKARTTFWFALPGVLLVGALVPDIAWSQAETDVKQPGKVVVLQAEPRDEPGGLCSGRCKPGKFKMRWMEAPSAILCVWCRLSSESVLSSGLAVSVFRQV